MNFSNDMHICGTCKRVFIDLKLFLEHKPKCFSLQENELFSSNTPELDTGMFPNHAELELTVLNSGSFPFILYCDNEEVVSDNSLQAGGEVATQHQLDRDVNQQVLTSRVVSDIDEEDVATLLANQLSKEVVNNNGTKNIQETDCSLEKLSNSENLNESEASVENEATEETVEETTIRQKQLVCNVCNFKPMLQRDLVRHMRKHTGERPYECGICGKKFARQDKLVTHRRIHTGDKRFKCQLCEYATTDSTALRKHLQIHTDERPHKCQMCSYRARNASHMTVHLRTHTGDSPFFCKFERCDRAFKTGTDLRRHMKVHKNENTSPVYSSFDDMRVKKQRVRHRRGVRVFCVKSHECSYCNAAFVRQDSLRSHVKQHQLNGDSLRPGIGENEEREPLRPGLFTGLSAVGNDSDSGYLQDSLMPLDQQTGPCDISTSFL